MNSQHLPLKGRTAESIFADLNNFKTNDVPWASGRAFAYVYEPPADAKSVISQAFVSYLSENVLDPTSFPSVLTMERALISMVANLLGGNEKTVGNITSGGTESIILALKSARDWFRANVSKQQQPEVILAVTAHAAFFKACHYLDLKPIIVDVDTDTFQVKTELLSGLITSNTVLLVGSAPNYSHGVADDIVVMGQIAKQYNIFFHVDACVGGFYLPFKRKAGELLAPFSLEVEGVSSISCDLHKYGYTFKSASVILYQSAELRQYQIYTCSEWSGYSLVNPTVASSRSGAALAGAWACLNYLGEDGYIRLNKITQSATTTFIKGIANIPELKILGTPVMNLVAVSSQHAHVSVFKIAERLKTKGWYVQTQLASKISKETLHLNINPANAEWIVDLLSDIKIIVAQLVAENEQLDIFPAEVLTDLLNSPDGLNQIFATFGTDGQKMPDDYVLINNFLNQLSTENRNRLLTAFANRLFVSQ
jgi:sphinganine-1-phosphate aldolase